MREISKLTELRKLMLNMEHSLGLQLLSTAERDVYYAASEISEAHMGVETATLMSHVLVANVSRPTFFRALKALVEKGYIAHDYSSNRGLYLVI